MDSLWDSINVFISSYWGMYAVQVVLHSAVASVIVECALVAWDIRRPRIKQWFRILVILLPIVLFPLYQLISVRRGDVYFRLDSLLDSNKWFFLELWGGVPAIVVFLAVLMASSIIFVLQELVPIIVQLREQRLGGEGVVPEPVDEAVALKVATALEGLPFDKSLVEIMNDDDLALFSSTGRRPAIYVSTGLVESFTTEHLRVAFAHEIGHIQRSRRPLLIFTYVLRAVMFYNPVAMIEFRKLAQEEEKVCDDIALALTDNPVALAEAIEMLRPAPEDHDIENTRREAGPTASAIEQYGHDALLRSRIQRIGRARGDDAPWAIPFATTLSVIIGINYFVV